MTSSAEEKQMRSRVLGQGLEVSAVGLGCMGMSQSYGPNPGSRDDDPASSRRAAGHGAAERVLPVDP